MPVGLFYVSYYSDCTYELNSSLYLALQTFVLNKLRNRDCYWLVLLAILCVVSRSFSTIYYIEDLDSLRFALSVVEYDVKKLQPHFPAYPIFCFFSKLIYWASGSYALAFSFLGGGSTFGLIFFVLRLAKTKIGSDLGVYITFLLFFNPLLWLMGNRYMPDLFGLLFLMAALYFLSSIQKNHGLLGFFLCGLLPGVRLSYLPFLLPYLFVRFREDSRCFRLISFGLLGVLVWLIPLVTITGWDNLIESARAQTIGHFNHFGGTVITKSDYIERFVNLFKSLCADGFGLYWSGRNWVTIIPTVTLALAVLLNWRIFLERANKGLISSVGLWGCAIYLAWVLFFQNVVYKSRHILPLIPFLALIPAYIFSHFRVNRRPFNVGLIAVFVICYVFITINLVAQHKRPTAIAQLHDYFIEKKIDDLHLVSVPLIKYYLSSQGLSAVYIPINDTEDLARLDQISSAVNLVSVGSPIEGLEPKIIKTFYHNPFVNRMWPKISLYQY